MGVGKEHVFGVEVLVWGGRGPIRNLLNMLEACTGAGVYCCSAVVVAIVQGMVQALWGGAAGAAWVGGAIYAVGCSPVVRANG